MRLKELQGMFCRFAKARNLNLEFWAIPLCAVTLACSRLITAQLSSHVPGANYNFDVLHHWQLILRWCVAPHRLLMLFALLFAILLSSLAFAQKKPLVRATLLFLTMTGTIYLEWSADYIAQNRPLILRPHRGDPSNQVDFKASKKAYKLFGLDRYSVPEMLIAAQIYYEQRFVQFKDVYLEDPWVQFLGDTPFGLDVSIGPAQIRKSRIIELVKEFPTELQNFRESTGSTSQTMPVNLRAALDKQNAAMLAAAYDASVIHRLENGEPACPDQPPSINQMIANLWKKGDPTSRAIALGESYCPGSIWHGQLVADELKRIERWNRSGVFDASEQLYIESK